MHLSRAVDYAIRAMAQLATLPPGGVMTRISIAREIGISETFLAKIMRRLVTARLVRSQPGAGGGYALARPPKTIPLMRIVEAVDGRLSEDECLLHNGPCERRAWCGIHSVLEPARMEMVRALEGNSVADVLRAESLPTPPPVQLIQVK